MDLKREQIVLGLCDDCKKVTEDNYCEVYLYPSVFVSRGGCPMRFNGNIFNKSRGSIDFLWKSVVERKERKGRQTPGRSKSENCKTTPIDGWMAKKSRSYKDKDYANWHTKKLRLRQRYGG